MSISRRDLLVGLGLVAAQAKRPLRGASEYLPQLDRSADVTLRISQMRHEVAPGHVVRTRCYNGDLTGKPIRLREGLPHLIEVRNETGTEEYLHWHGLMLPAEQDGTPEEKSFSVPAHGSLRYSLIPKPAGLRFIHSHAMAMDDLNAGAYSGQFAPVFVETKSESGNYDREVFLTTHEWEPYFTTDEREEAAMDSPLHQLMGEGRLLRSDRSAMREVGYRVASINGKALGFGEPLRVRRGQRVLFRVVNASATQNVRLALPHHRFLVVALDGNAVANPAMVDVLSIGAAERVDALVVMDTPGIWVMGSTDPDARERGLGIVVEYAGASGRAVWQEAPESVWDYGLFGKSESVPGPVEVLPMAISRLPSIDRGRERWAINGREYSDNDEPTPLRLGKRYRLMFTNETDEAHPLHFHRSRFEISSIDKRPVSGVRKDVVVVQPFQALSVDLTPEEKGLALFHCHQQLHMDAGFKRLFLVCD